MIKSRRIRWICSTHGDVRYTYEIRAEKLEGYKPLEIPRHKSEDKVKMSLKHTVWICGLDSAGSKRVSLALSCDRENKLSGFIKHEKCLE
jgi:hypothetical protein